MTLRHSTFLIGLFSSIIGLSLPNNMVGGTMVSLPSTVIITFEMSLYALYYPENPDLGDILQWQWIQLDDISSNIDRLHGLAIYYKPNLTFKCHMSTNYHINKQNITS